MNISKTWLWIIIVIAALALIGWLAGRNGFLTQPLSGGDTTAEINKDLNAVDVGNPDQDLKQLNADINSL